MLDQPSWMQYECSSYAIRIKRTKEVMHDLGTFDDEDEAQELLDHLPTGDEFEVFCEDEEPDMHP